MDAINDLKKEHEGIRLMLQVLQAVSRKLGRGERINAQHLGGIMEFLSIFVDKCHHGKEEEFLFPALEASGIPREGGPIGAMLAEHDQGRRIVSELRDAVKSYNSGDKSAADSIKSRIDAYVELLTQHIEKENTVLFVMADARLDTAKDSELVKAFERLENERIGAGKHEEFHEFLHELDHEYLGWGG
ncbi:MAG: hemerythrin domain-containing protein [Dissulfurimicrobium hydrothermale]